MDGHRVTFRCSALAPADRPQEWVPHIAVAGRSNVGKSSLINWLFRTALARVAKAPGKTTTLNFYDVGGSFYLVDLPGYGYAKVNQTLRQQWDRQLAAYLAAEPRLAGVVALVDIRQGPTTLDLHLHEVLVEHDRPRLVVLTKADKVGRGPRRAMQDRVRTELELDDLPLAVSVRTGEGRRELMAAMDGLATTWNEHQRRN